MKPGEQAAVWCAVVAFTATIASAQMYSVVDLGNGRAYGINDSGQVVGVGTVAGPKPEAFLYTGGSFTAIGGPGGVAYGINDSGQIVGQNSAGDAFLDSGGSMEDLGALGGTGSAAYGINDSGQVVGAAAYDNPLGESHAFLYSGGVMTDLGTLGGSGSSGVAINSGGAIAGWSLTARDGDQSPFLYAGGIMTNLPYLGQAGNSLRPGIKPLSIGPSQSLGSANGINDAGQIVGKSEFYAGNAFSHAFLYSDGIMTDLGTLATNGPAFSVANAVNNQGEIVGASWTAGGTISTATNHAFVCFDGTMIDLNSLIATNAGWTLTEANAINDNGWIVGEGTGPSGQAEAFLLVPTPEPHSLLPVGLGLLGLALARRPGSSRVNPPD